MPGNCPMGFAFTTRDDYEHRAIREFPGAPKKELQEVSWPAEDAPFCDCPEPCARHAEGYAAGKDKAYFEVIASLEGPPHAEGCACQVKQACLQRVTTLMSRSSPTLFELLEGWNLDGHDN